MIIIVFVPCSHSEETEFYNSMDNKSDDRSDRAVLLPRCIWQEILPAMIYHASLHFTYLETPKIKKSFEPSLGALHWAFFK